MDSDSNDDRDGGGASGVGGGGCASGGGGGGAIVSRVGAEVLARAMATATSGGMLTMVMMQLPMTASEASFWSWP